MSKLKRRFADDRYWFARQRDYTITKSSIVRVGLPSSVAMS